MLYGDCCEDMAQVYFQREDYETAEVWIEHTEAVIPALYKIQEDTGLGDVPIEECIEEFWQLMGKTELLRGHLAYERGRLEGLGKVPRTSVEQMTQHYAFAATYFERYSERAVRLESTFKQVYTSFQALQDRRPPSYSSGATSFAWTTASDLNPAALTEFFGDTLGMVAHV